MPRTLISLIAGLVLLPLCAHSQDMPLPLDARISVDARKVVGHVSSWLYGSCIEDVNHEIYGGLYDQKLFGESFEEPPPPAQIDGWTDYGGAWQPHGQTVRADADAGAKLVLHAPDFADGTVEADVKLSGDQGGNAGLLVRIRNPGVGADSFDGYEVSLDVSRGRLILGKHRHDFQPLQEAPVPLAPDQWQHLRVTLNGPRLRIFVNNAGAPLIDFIDRDHPLLTGGLALRTWNTDAAFQNVRAPSRRQEPQNAFLSSTSDSVSGQWDAVKTGSAAGGFLWDPDRPFNGTHSQKIQHGIGTGVVGVANRGLNRWGIAVQKGQTLGGRIYLRAQRLHGPATLTLQSADGARTYAAAEISDISTAWAKYSFALTPDASDNNARFAVFIDRPGTLWTDQAVLTGTGAARFKSLPIRADIADTLAAQGVTFLRYGGTMVNVPGYRWKNMIGDPDRRPPYKGNWYPYSTNGFGIFDFLNFCEAAKIVPAFAINIEETAQDAGDLAEYLNGSVSTVWGKRRAQDGHPTPYQVRWIEIGNEEVIGSDDAAAYAHYIERFQRVSDAIHARDPNIQLVCAAWWRPDSANVQHVFQALNGKAAFWDLHVWADDTNAGVNADRQLTQMQALFQQWATGTTMKCVIFEENGNRHDQQRALGHAAVQNAIRRHADFVAVDCPANALQPWQQNDNGWDQGQIFFTPDRVWVMPPYYAQQMAAQTHLPLTVQSACLGSPSLDISAARSEDGSTLVLHVVNTGRKPQRALVSLTGFAGVQAQGRVWTLTAAPDAVNAPGVPEAVHPQQSLFQDAAAQFAYTFPPCSYTLLRLQR